MAEVIRGTDPSVMDRCRSAKVPWSELSPPDRAVYDRVYTRLEQIGREALLRLSGRYPFALSLTSGFSLKGGVRGSLPKDLWIAIHHIEAALGMPQIYMIMSGRGVEFGFAAAIHTSDFSSQPYREKVRLLVQELFPKFPPPQSTLISELSATLTPGTWFFARKTRQDPRDSGFSRFEELIAFLRSDAGRKWGAGAACRYLSPADLDRDDMDLVELFSEAVERFAPLLASVYVAAIESPELGRKVSGSTVEQEIEDQAVPSDVLRSSLEEILNQYPRIRQGGPFKKDEQLWSAFGNFSEIGLSKVPSIKGDPNVRVTWSAGQGNWAAIPWIAILDRKWATSIQNGVYVVFLFREDMSGVYATLIQGTTDVIARQGRTAGRQALHDQAAAYAAKLQHLGSKGFHLTSAEAAADNWIDLKTEVARGEDYEFAVIAGRFYPKDSVPGDDQIVADLTELIAAQERLGLPVQNPEQRGQRRIWLVAPGENAKYWEDFYRKGIVAIGWDELGALDSFSSQEEIEARLNELRGGVGRATNDAQTCFDFVHTIKEGDIVFVKRGRSIILGDGVVTGPFFWDERRPVLKNTRAVRWERRGEWSLPDSLLLPVKTLTDISDNPELLRAFESLLGRKDESAEVRPERPEIAPFDPTKSLDDVFTTPEEFDQMVRVWRDKKNLILQGPPGVGKTFLAKTLSYALMGMEDDSRVTMVQFHQSYSYEDFIQGYRPTPNGLTLKSGRFLVFCERAAKDISNSYVFIIDEINRGNLSKIFGELMMTIEADKRGAQWSVPLAYAEKESEQFSVPENVYLLGLMNTADRSLSIVDYALRRRFAFISLQPMVKSSRFAKFLGERRGVPDQLVAQIQSRVGELNDFIADKGKSGLGPGFCIGHSYFVPGDETSGDATWYKRVIETQIVPTLEEYWFDNETNVEEWRSKLLAGL